MIGLIGCSSSKLDHAAPARALYTSQLFRKSLAYAGAWCEQVYILSAAHGLVGLDQELAPYDVTLTTKAERAAWASRTAHDLALRHGPRVELLVLAGAVYADPLVDELVLMHGHKVELVHRPLARLQVGERLSLLTHGLVRAPHELRRFVARRAREVSID